MSKEIKIHVLHCGTVCVAPDLPFGNPKHPLGYTGIGTPKSKRIWLPVSAYLIEHPKGLVLLDTGWHREISPKGKLDKKGQIKNMSRILYHVNQGVVPIGKAIDEQLEKLKFKMSDVDYVVMSHLDCDHASAIRLCKDAQHIIVSEPELKYALKHPLRYTKSMWEGVKLETFKFEDLGIGPYGKAYDLFGDGSMMLVNIPGHSDGLVALMIRNNRKFVLLFSDGGYSSKSWKEMIFPGTALKSAEARKSLEWIREMSMKSECVESLANHDPDVKPHVITL